MSWTIARRILVLLASTGAGFSVWRLAPATPEFRLLDRAAFTAVAGASCNPPLFVSGEGTRGQPWTLRTVAANGAKSKRGPAAPAVVAIGDDPERVFQSSPLSQVDYAVILKNLQRLGVKRAALGVVMAWGESDPLARAALDRQMGGFESLVTATPLTRGATSEPVPGAFLRASLPLDRVRGNAALLPVVNRLPVPGTVLGDGRELAGFTELESEAPSGALPLLARWDDRVVLAFPLVALLADRGLSVDDLDVRLGHALQLGKDGPLVPLDAFGRFAAGAAKFPPAPSIAAESLIDASAMPAGAPVVVRDDRRVADASVKRFSAALVPALQSLAASTGVSAPRPFARLSELGESLFLSGIVWFQVLLAAGGPFRRHVSLLLCAGLLVAAQFAVAGLADVWLPGLAGLAAVLAGWLVSWPPRERKPAPVDESSAPDAA